MTGMFDAKQAVSMRLTAYNSWASEYVANTRTLLMNQWLGVKKLINIFTQLAKPKSDLNQTLKKIEREKIDSTARLPKSITQPSSDLDIAQQLRNFCDELDQFLIARIQSEERRLTVAPMLMVTITASQYGRTMLDLMRNDLDNLIDQLEHIKLNGDSLKSRACEKILILHIDGFLLSLKKFISSFMKVAITLNQTIQNPGHTRNQQELAGILNIIQTIEQRFRCKSEVMAIIGLHKPATYSKDWQHELFSKIIGSNDPHATEILLTLATDQQFDYILLQAKICALEVMTNLYALQKEKLQPLTISSSTTAAGKDIEFKSAEAQTKQKKYFLRSRELQEKLGSHCPQPKSEDPEDILASRISSKASSAVLSKPTGRQLGAT